MNLELKKNEEAKRNSVKAATSSTGLTSHYMKNKVSPHRPTVQPYSMKQQNNIGGGGVPR